MLLPKGAAEKAVHQTRETATKLEDDFIKASLDHHTRDQQRRRWRLAQVGLIGGAIAVLSLTWAAWLQWDRARRSERVASAIGKTAEEVQQNLDLALADQEERATVLRSYATYVRAEERRRENEHDVARLLAVETWRLREMQWSSDFAHIRDQLIDLETIRRGPYEGRATRLPRLCRPNAQRRRSCAALRRGHEPRREAAGARRREGQPAALATGRQSLEPEGEGCPATRNLGAGLYTGRRVAGGGKRLGRRACV